MQCAISEWILELKKLSKTLFEKQEKYEYLLVLGNSTMLIPNFLRVVNCIVEFVGKCSCS